MIVSADVNGDGRPDFVTTNRISAAGSSGSVGDIGVLLGMATAPATITATAGMGQAVAGKESVSHRAAGGRPR